MKQQYADFLRGYVTGSLRHVVNDHRKYMALAKLDDSDQSVLLTIHCSEPRFALSTVITETMVDDNEAEANVDRLVLDSVMFTNYPDFVSGKQDASV